MKVKIAIAYILLLLFIVVGCCSCVTVKCPCDHTGPLRLQLGPQIESRPYQPVTFPIWPQFDKNGGTIFDTTFRAFRSDTLRLIKIDTTNLLRKQ